MHNIALVDSPSFVEHLKIFPAAKYSLANPVVHNIENLNSDIKDLVLREHKKTQVACPPVHVSRLKDTVVNPNGSLVDSAGAVIRESAHDFAKSMNAQQTTEQSALSGTGIVLFKYGFRNYGHWLIEMLPKLYFIKSCLKQNPDSKILVGDLDGGLENIVYSTLVTFGISASSILPTKQSTCVKDVIYCSPITNHPFMMRPEIRDFYKDVANINADAEKKLFVTRPASGNRVLDNLGKIESYFKELGYEIVEPGKLSFEQQVEIFSSANEVYGIAGAAMTNTIFCRKHTKIVHIVPPSMPNLFFYQLASICDHSYSEFRGQSDNGMFSKSFDIDFDDLRKSIELSNATIPY